MLSAYCFGNLVLYFFSLIFCIFLAPNSLLYYVVKYDISKEQLQTFIEQLKFPYTLLTLNQNSGGFVTVNSILDKLDEYKKLSPLRLQYERFPGILVPALSAFAGIYRLTLPGQLFVDNIAVALLMSYGFFIAMRFGSSLRNQK